MTMLCQTTDLYTKATTMLTKMDDMIIINYVEIMGDASVKINYDDLDDVGLTWSVSIKHLYSK